MKESEAIEKLKNMRLYMQIEDESNDCKFTEDDYRANEMAINALEKQEKIKEVFTHYDFYGCELNVNDYISALSEIKAILKE